MALNPKDKRYLRTIAHHIRPCITTGKEGLKESILIEIHEALDRDELIKVKIGKGELHRKDAVEIIREKVQSEVVQLLGRNVLLFRKRVRDSNIHFPK
ncbi:MAG: ribosome assembly RNA-binding protein YhbY [Deltaproteobacteria bacterium]|nr:ribosome assembly RNA-binding protein YhbY [Deltaproteobacteria bacterium]